MIYEYKCLECGEKFEVVKSMKDSAKKERCFQCGAVATQVVTGGCGFNLCEGGAGFYAVDKLKNEKVVEGKDFEISDVNREGSSK